MLLLCCLLRRLFLGLSSLLQNTRRVTQHQEMSRFECGFNNLKNSRTMYFSASYFSYRIIFLVFDIEMCLVLPIASMKGRGGIYLGGLLGLGGILAVFLYELEVGIITWEG